MATVGVKGLITRICGFPSHTERREYSVKTVGSLRVHCTVSGLTTNQATTVTTGHVTTAAAPPIGGGACDPNPCRNHGRCVANSSSSAGFTCECPPSVWGPLCQHGQCNALWMNDLECLVKVIRGQMNNLIKKVEISNNRVHFFAFVPTKAAQGVARFLCNSYNLQCSCISRCFCCIR